MSPHLTREWDLAYVTINVCFLVLSALVIWLARR